MISVKALEWTQDVFGDGTCLRQNVWFADRYQIVESPSGKYDLRSGTYAICDTLDEAKSVAQADYSARIMSAIEPAGETMTQQEAMIREATGREPEEPAGVGVETPPPQTHEGEHKELVWVQNLKGFIKGEFPADERWKRIFLERLDAPLRNMVPTEKMVDACIEANTRAKLFGGDPRDWVKAGLRAALTKEGEQ